MSRAVVDAKEFSHAMSKISKILKKCAIPILEEVCLRIQNGRCTLTATDLETWLTAELPASGDDMFFVFRKTKDILRACSHFAGELTMEFSETRSGSKKAGKVLLRCERRGAEFEVYDGADYPNMPQAPEGDAFSVSSARLSACVERVRYAAEKPSVSARPAAICVQFCGNRVYALDGTRLACDKGGYNMSIKSQEGHMRQLALLLTTDLGCIFDERESGPNGSKKAFLNVGKVFLRALAKDLGLHEVTVSANSGGIAVSGTCSLYGMWEDRGIAVWIEQRLCADGKVLCYRTIRSSRDFKGGYNHFLTSSDLKTWSYPQLLETLSALRKDGCRYERTA